MRTHAFSALTDLLITWLLFCCVFFFAMQHDASKRLIELATEQASTAPFKTLVPAAVLLIAIIFVVGAVVRQASNPKHWKSLIGSVLGALGGGFATIASGMFFTGLLHHQEWVGMLVAGVLGWAALFTSKLLDA